MTTSTKHGCRAIKPIRLTGSNFGRLQADCCSESCRLGSFVLADTWLLDQERLILGTATPCELSHRLQLIQVKCIAQRCGKW